LPVTLIAAGLRQPERLIGLHFFNPVPLMKVAEVIPGARTRPGLAEWLAGTVRASGHTAVTVADTPGFL
ncbi:3-hydroxyacyl-CoA dehydrogenase, partial [Streptomyces fulvissimus]